MSKNSSKSSRVHPVKENCVVKAFRIIPYDDLVILLKKDEAAFFENSVEQPLKNITIWKAAKKLSRMVGRKVVAHRALYRVKDISLEGYLFEIEAEESPGQ